MGCPGSHVRSCVAVGILILDAGINMFIKMKKKVIPCAIMGCHMTLKNCITAPEWQAIDLWPTLITLILATLYWESRRMEYRSGEEICFGRFIVFSAANIDF